MVELETTPGRTCLINGEEFLFFSGYSYLGVNHLKEFRQLVTDGIDKYGILFQSSRISNTRLKLYAELENDLSQLTGMQDTVSFSSGFLAGITISDILTSYKNVFTAPGTHPAIKAKTFIEDPDENFTDWGERITGVINSSAESEFVICGDSINILKSEIHDFSFIKNIHQDKKIITLIDDSHGIGILGTNGEGIISQLPNAANIDCLVSYSLSKAFNIEGGAISCSKFWSDQLRQHSNYTSSTAINPSLINAFLKSKSLYSTQREKLFENISYLSRKCSFSGVLKNNFGLPIFICNKENAEEYFYNHKIIISSFGYPYPSSAKTDRVIINALHTTEDINQLWDACNY